MTNPTKLSLAAVVSLAAWVPAQFTFRDSFEAPSLNPFWTATTLSGAITLSSTVHVHSGSYSVQFDSFNTGADKHVYLSHVFAVPTYGTVSVWMFDTGAQASSSNYIGLMVNNSTINIATFDYNLGPTSGGTYAFATPTQTTTLSSITRTLAWHEFSISSSPSSLVLTIDGATVYAGAGGYPLSDLRLYMGGPSWRPAWSCNFDDFTLITPGPISGQSNSPCATLLVNGAGASGNGPFVVSAPAGSTLSSSWAGPANQPLVLLASSAFALGQNFGAGVLVDLDLATSSILFNGLNPVGGLLFWTNASQGAFGTAAQTFTIPTAAAGAVLRVQGIVLDLAGVCAGPGYMTTASFEIRM